MFKALYSHVVMFSLCFVSFRFGLAWFSFANYSQPTLIASIAVVDFRLLSRISTKFRDDRILVERNPSEKTEKVLRANYGL